MDTAHGGVAVCPIKHGLSCCFWFQMIGRAGILSGMSETFKPLPDDPAELRAVSELMVQHIQSLTYQNEKLKAELDGHRKARFGSKSETSEQRSEEHTSELQSLRR